MFIFTTATTQNVTDFLLSSRDYLCMENTNQNVIGTLQEIQSQTLSLLKCLYYIYIYTYIYIYIYIHI